MRPEGLQMEFEGVLGPDREMVDVKVTGSRTRKIGSVPYGQGVSTADLPLFHTEQDLISLIQAAIKESRSV